MFLLCGFLVPQVHADNTDIPKALNINVTIPAYAEGDYHGKYALRINLEVLTNTPKFCALIESVGYFSYSGVGCLDCSNKTSDIQWSGSDIEQVPAEEFFMQYVCSGDLKKDYLAHVEKIKYGIKVDTICRRYNYSMALFKEDVQCSYWVLSDQKGFSKLSFPEGGEICHVEKTSSYCIDSSGNLSPFTEWNISDNLWCITDNYDILCPMIFGAHIP